MGAWVQRFIPSIEGFSEPLYVYGLYDGGSLNLNVAGNPGDALDARVEEICPIPMDEHSMRGFGFVRVAKGENVWMKSVGDIRLTVSLRFSHGTQECRRAAISGRFACWNEEIRYVHELQSWWRDKVLLPYGVELDLEWRGDEGEKEESD